MELCHSTTPSACSIGYGAEEQREQTYFHHLDVVRKQRIYTRQPNVECLLNVNQHSQLTHLMLDALPDLRISGLEIPASIGRLRRYEGGRLEWSTGPTRS